MKNLQINQFGVTEYREGSKSITVSIRYEGHKKIYAVRYYDDIINQIEKSTIPNCCRPMTEAHTEIGALREIKKFFNE